MIKFFRQIRHKLIDQSNLRKYLFYAVGEILLVMIGILLALQVNNWNEKKKMIKDERKYYIRIYSDLEVDSIYLSQRLKKSKQEIESYYTFIHEAYKDQKSKEEFVELIGYTWFSSEHLTVQNSTFQEMINSGKLDLISNDSLKDAIIELYRNYDAAEKHIQEFNQYSVSLLTEWAKVINDTKYRGVSSSLFDEPYMFTLDNWKWINNQSSIEFRLAEETVGAYSAKNKVFIKYFNQLLDEVNALRNVIRNVIRNELDN